MDITSTEASMDGFINDIITITVDDEHWIDHAKSAALLVIYTLFRTPQPSEPLKWDDLLSLRKLAGEVKISEKKTCLGRHINTHSLRVFLPEEKHTAWTNDINWALASKNIKTYTLESLIGKLNHAAYVISLAWYFLDQLHHLLKTEKYKDNKGSNYGIAKIYNCGWNYSNMSRPGGYQSTT